MSRWVHHRLIEQLILKKTYPEIAYFMDSPSWEWGLGRRHRIVFHDPVWTPIIILARQKLAGRPFDFGEVLACLLHIAQDRVDSAIGLTRFLDIIDEVEKSKRKRIKSSARSSRPRRRQPASRSRR